MASGSSTYETLGLKVSNFNIVLAVLGTFLSLFGLVSYLLKEKFYLGEALISTIAGLVVSPHAVGIIKPLEYVGGSQENLNAVTLYFSRLVLGVQLVLAGVQLPSKYLWKERKPLALLIGPGMCVMWITTSLLVWALVPNLNILQALAVGACVTPTDPVLSNGIVKGKFADRNIPKELQRIIIAESGANDGLGYPFLFLPLYLLRYVHDGGQGQTGGAAKAMGYWFGITWGYEIIFSVVYGALVGWIFKEALHWAEERKYVDRESFLVFAITLALFIVGTLGMLGSDDVLACFVAGNSFTWDDWFRLETQDDSFQPTIDMLLNVSIFAWYGAICPWYSLAHNDVVPIYRLIFLGLLTLLLRRPPIVFAMHHKIPQIEETRQALFVGYFGPIGVSAIFYLYTSMEYLSQVTVNGVQRADAVHLSQTMEVVVWFLVICSIIVHGLSIPLGKLGLQLPRTLSIARSTTTEKRQKPSGSSSASRTNLEAPVPSHPRDHNEHTLRNLDYALQNLATAATQEQQAGPPPAPKPHGKDGTSMTLRAPRKISHLLHITGNRNASSEADGEQHAHGASTPQDRTIEGIRFARPEDVLLTRPRRDRTPQGRTTEGIKFADEQTSGPTTARSNDRS